MSKQFSRPKDLLTYLKDNKINFIELWLTDIQGQLKSISINRKHLKLTEDEKNLMPKGFDGSSIAGMSGVSHSDLMAIPEWQILYTLPQKMSSAGLFCKVTDCEKMPFYQGDWRAKLRANLDKIKDNKSYDIKLGIDLEFYIFDHPPKPNAIKFEASDAKGYFELGSANIHQELLTELIRDAEGMGVRIARAHHEGEFGQLEIELAAEDPVQMADNVIILRHLVRNLARDYGKIATFIPKPSTEKEGSAMHLRMGIFKENENVLYEQDDISMPELSIAGKSAIVGLTRHSYSLMLATNQWVNSYKRLQPGFDAPCNLNCSVDIRETSLHINHTLDNHVFSKELAIHITHPDAACNPYLAFNALISCALAENSTDNYQLVETLDPLLEIQKQLAKTQTQKQLAEVIDPLKEIDSRTFTDTLVTNQFEDIPQDLGQAITAFIENLTDENSIAISTFGSELCNSLIKIKSEQWDEFQKHVSDWEVQRYQRVF